MRDFIYHVTIPPQAIKVRSTAALAEIFLTGFLPFSDMLCIDKFYFV